MLGLSVQVGGAPRPSGFLSPDPTHPGMIQLAFYRLLLPGCATPRILPSLSGSGIFTSYRTDPATHRICPLTNGWVRAWGLRRHF